MDATSGLFGYYPHALQAKFHHSRGRIRLFLGGNGSGKTVGGGADLAMILAGCHPTRSFANPETGEPAPFAQPGKAWIVSPDWRFINDVQHPMLRSFLPYELIKPGAAGTKKHPNGSISAYFLTNGWEVHFRSAESGAEKLQGDKVHAIWVDEFCDQDCFNELLARTFRCRGDIIVTATPVGGLGAHNQHFFDEIYQPWEEGRVGKDKWGNPDFDVIEVSSYDNPYLEPDEIERMRRKWSPAEQEIRLHGKFRSLTGTVFPEFDRRIHVVDPETLPDGGRLAPHWPKSCGMDHGAGGEGHSSAHFAALRDDGMAVIAGEYYESAGVGAFQHAAALRRLQGVGPFGEMTPVSLDRTARQFGIELSLAGVPVIKSKSDRAAGHERIHDLLAPSFGHATGLLIYSTCVNLVRDLPRYTHEAAEGRRAAHKRTHSVDSARYTLMALQRQPVRVVGQEPVTPSERLAAMERQLLAGEDCGTFTAAWGEDGLGEGMV